MERDTVILPAIQPARAARKSEWLRSALAHHHCAQPGVENEIVVLAIGIDQYIQEVFHHLAYPNQDDVVSAEDFTVLCAVLGLTTEGERRGQGDGEEDDDEGRCVCSGLPHELSFKDFHSRLCGYFRVHAARNGAGGSTVRLPVTEETELVEREIRLRWPRVRRRKYVSFDLRDHTNKRPVCKSTNGPKVAEDHETAASDQQCDYEAAALRELVEDLRSALQGSDARCLALEVALRRERAHNALTHTHPNSPDLISSSTTTSNSLTPGKMVTPTRQRGVTVTPSSQGRGCGVGGEGVKRDVQKQDTTDPLLLRELKLIRSSRDGQLEEAIKFNQRLEEEMHWAYQEIRRLKGVELTLRKENAEIRRRAEEARQALRQGLQRVRLIQEQAQTVPTLQTRVTQLETELQEYRTRCTCGADPTHEPLHPMGAEDTCIRTECLQRAVEGRAASDEEEEERGKREERGKEERRREEGQCCLMEVKKLISILHSCSIGCQNPAIHRLLLSQVHLHDNNLTRASKDGRGRGHKGHEQLEDRGNELEKRSEEVEGLRMEVQLVETERVRLSLLEEKLTDALTLLLQLRNKNVSRRALGKILMDTLDMCTRSGHGPSQVLQVADALCVQLSSNELLRDGVKEGGRREGGRERGETQGVASSGHQSSSTNPLVISC